MELVLGPSAGPLGGLGSEEDLLADLGQDLAVDLLGAAVPVAVGGVEVVDAQLDGPPGQRDRLVGRDQGKASAGQADDGELDAGLAERPPGDIAGPRSGFRAWLRGCPAPANSPPTKPPMRVLRLMGVLRSKSGEERPIGFGPGGVPGGPRGWPIYPGGIVAVRDMAGKRLGCREPPLMKIPLARDILTYAVGSLERYHVASFGGPP